MEKKFTWHKVAEHINELPFSENGIALLEVKGKKVCVTRFNDEVFAFANSCPHAGGWLSDGFLDAQGHIVCPIHRYRYDLRNGRNVTGEGYHLKHWPVETRLDGLYVGLDEGSGFWNIF